MDDGPCDDSNEAVRELANAKKKHCSHKGSVARYVPLNLSRAQGSQVSRYLDHRLSLNTEAILEKQSRSSLSASQEKRPRAKMITEHP